LVAKYGSGSQQQSRAEEEDLPQGAAAAQGVARSLDPEDGFLMAGGQKEGRWMLGRRITLSTWRILPVRGSRDI
jgi:hypothetical protein